MKTLALNLKRKYFDEILAGTKAHEYRDIFPENVKKFVYYSIGEKIFSGDAEFPSEEELPGEVVLCPIEYDCIKLLKGAYFGRHPYMVIEVKAAEIKYTHGENGENIIVLDEETGIEFIAAQVDYTLDNIIEIFDC